jgi:ABC-type glycerol-3-phosphate transport system permease component
MSQHPPIEGSVKRSVGMLSRQVRGWIPHIVIWGLLFLTFYPFIFTLQTSLKSFEQLLFNFWFPALPLYVENYLIAWQEIGPVLPTWK